MTNYTLSAFVRAYVYRLGKNFGDISRRNCLEILFKKSSMASWEEIKKLAADLHRAQLGEAAKKLSERNCVEIVTNLVENGLINVVYSIDGKDYITKDYLTTQIINETIANEGRISLGDLQQVLNVHYQTVEDQAKCVVESRPDFMLCLGQLITRDYLNRMCSEIDEKLNEEGRLTLSQITKSYDLPTDLLRDEVYGGLSDGRVNGTVDSNDSSVLYTKSYVHEQTSVLRGAFSAITRPIPVAKLISEINVEPGLFFSCFDSLCASNQIRGVLTGGRHLERSVYVPEVFLERTEKYLKDFYHQNNYIELSSLKKLNVTDSSNYLNKLFGPEAKSLVYLKDIVISNDSFESVRSAVEESIERDHWTDITSHLPFSFTETDQKSVANLLHKRHLNDWTLCCDVFFYKDELASKFVKYFDPLISAKALQEAPKVAKLLRQTNANVTPSVDVADGKKGGKGGGAKGKKAKGQTARGRAGDEEDDFGSSQQNQLEFMSKQELIKTLSEKGVAENCPEEILDEVCDRLVNSFNKKYRSQVESVYLTEESVNLKKSHGEFGDKFRLLYQNICIFDAGTLLFSETVAEQLKIYLLRSLVTDLVNATIGYYAHVPNATQMTPKIRDATIDEMAPAVKSSFQKLTSSLNAKDLNSFYDAVDEIAAPNICSLNVKRPDKKIRSDIIARHKDELLNQLNEGNDPTTGLLLACCLLIAHYIDNMVHSSGKFVPQLMALLQDKIPRPVYSLLLETQKLVVQQLKSKDSTITEETKQKYSELKSEVTNCLRSTTDSSEN